MKGTVEVRIRRDDEAKAVKFTRWPLAKLEEVIHQISAWGISDLNDNSFGQFVFENSEAYFEIVVGVDE